MGPKKAAKGKAGAKAVTPTPVEEVKPPAEEPKPAAPPAAEVKKVVTEADELKSLVDQQKKGPTDELVELCLQVSKKAEELRTTSLTEEEREKLNEALKKHGDVKKNVPSIKMPIIKFAVALECLHLVEYFIKKGADYLTPNEFGCTLLHMTDSGVITKFIIDRIKSKEEKERLINLQNNRGVTPFHLAVYRKDYTTIQYLLQNGADPSIVSTSAKKNAYEMFPKDDTLQKLLKKYTKKKFLPMPS